MYFRQIKYEGLVRTLRGPDEGQPELSIHDAKHPNIKIWLQYPQIMVEDRLPDGGINVRIVNRDELEERFNIIL